jgi:hypothetical protein
MYDIRLTGRQAVLFSQDRPLSGMAFQWSGVNWIENCELRHPFPPQAAACARVKLEMQAPYEGHGPDEYFERQHDKRASTGRRMTEDI